MSSPGIELIERAEYIMEEVIERHTGGATGVTQDEDVRFQMTVAESRQEVVDVDNDVAMGNGSAPAAADTSQSDLNGSGGNGVGGATGAPADNEPAQEAPLTFIDYLKSPIIEIMVGSGNVKTLLTAHQALLVQSPFFADACAGLDENENQLKRVELADHELDAVGCFLQYLYTGEYFPRKLENTRGLESNPNAGDGSSEPDDSGEQLLKHARVYTLADKLGVPALQTLAHSKIHMINSTAKGEIAYARFVYANTPRDDLTIRKPIAAFWAHRSHVLRHEAEEAFRSMCLEFPEFSYDVLNLVLDAKEKRGDKDRSGGKEKERAGKGRGSLEPAAEAAAAAGGGGVAVAPGSASRGTPVERSSRKRARLSRLS
ncbi:MAG: hypothetical protein M1826_003117 [Phylliscum demangeonii]|nr:MAG: hypothetical protein M1826_003117 [Phylliscum demangeonii]